VGTLQGSLNLYSMMALLPIQQRMHGGWYRICMVNKENHANHINELLILFDGAGCFSGAELLLLMPHFYSWTGVKIK
jgi:hypothetical protein